MADPLPSAADVSRALAGIFGSSEFARAPVMRHLLSFLVNETIAGRGDRIKAYSVAVDALGRSPDFDPQVDSYPRVQVGRLRKMLDAYYAASTLEGLRLAIPLGGYRVEFLRPDDQAVGGAKPIDQEPRPTSERPRWPMVVRIGAVTAAALALVVYLLPASPAPQQARLDAAAPTIAIEIGDTSSTPRGRVLLAEIGRAIATPLSRSWLMTVVTGAASVDSRYALLIDLNTEETVASLRLIDRGNGRLLWGDQAAVNGEGDVATQLRAQISTLVRPSGIIGAQQRTALGSSFAPGYPCLLRFDGYFRDRDPEIAAAVKHCVAVTIAAQPGNAQALTAASFLMLDPNSGGGPANRSRALAFAERASRLAPYLPSAAVAEARMAMTGGNCARGRVLGARAVALDRYDPETLGMIGLLLFGCEPERARALLQEARTLDPDLTTFYVPALVLIDLRDGNRAGAIEQAHSMRTPPPGMVPQYLIAQTLAAIAADDEAGARRLWAQVVARTPAPNGSTDAVLAHYYYAPDFRGALARELGAAGLTVTPGRA